MSLTPEGAQSVKFSMTGKDGQPDRTINICDFYYEFYGARVTRPRLPCIQVSIEDSCQVVAC